FDPFFTTKPDGQGTGLGLSMIYGFAKQSGGHVQIASAPGQGATVRLYLPRAAGVVATVAERRPAHGRAREGSDTILVVEDDLAVRDAVVRLLGDLGYAVIAAGGAAEALAIIERHRAIDLLFTDVVMPGTVTTRELVERARAIAPRMRVLFTTGHAEDTIVRQSRLDHGALLLTKPYRHADLAAQIKRALAGI
ncbi:MAG: response regulator, partial [Proteobacteria bacterium]|nr:response regulator [Pseudomonadota bacterium]